MCIYDSAVYVLRQLRILTKRSVRDESFQAGGNKVDCMNRAVKETILCGLCSLLFFLLVHSSTIWHSNAEVYLEAFRSVRVPSSLRQAGHIVYGPAGVE